MAIEKILILAMPRTGTTIIQEILSRELGIANLSEPFARYIRKTDPRKDYPPDNDPYEWVAKQTSGIFKLLSTTLDHFDFEKIISIAKFDHVIMIERKNLVDGLLSLKYAELTDKYHRFCGETIIPQQFGVDQFDFGLWDRSYRLYNESKNLIINSNISYDLISYDDFVADIPQYVAGHLLQQSKALGNYNIIPNDLCYKDLCINYQEVETHIRNTTC
jgi:hypothetical protein